MRASQETEFAGTLGVGPSLVSVVDLGKGESGWKRTVAVVPERAGWGVGELSFKMQGRMGTFSACPRGHRLILM